MKCPNPQLHVQCKDGTWLRDTGRFGQFKSGAFRKLVNQHGGDTRAVVSGCKLPTCYACQQARASSWATKAFCESQLHDESCFVTLTYADDWLPALGQLQYRDVDLFVMRLRTHIRRSDKPVRIRYFYSGEYGESNGRPHYHIIIFGWKPDDLLPHGRAKNGDTRYTSQTLADLWGNGYVDVGTASIASMLYIANYIIGSSDELDQLLTFGHQIIVPGAQDLDLSLVNLKREQDNDIDQRSKGKDMIDVYSGEIITRVPPSVRASNRPGLGQSWFDKYGEECRKGYITINGTSVPLPSNFRKFVKEQFAADPTLESRYRPEIQSLEDIEIPDLKERARLSEFNRTVQYQKRIGAAYIF
jgi:hypothetical protein